MDLDQFFTDPDLAQRCIDRVDARYGLGSFAVIVEPSAGDGAFFQRLPTESRQGIDLDPKHPDIAKCDFFAWDPDLTRPGKVLTIGNPPFGRRCTLALRFFKRAAIFSDVIAFILPRSFNKPLFQDRLPPFFHLVESFDCDRAFAHEGKDVEVGTVFQIWERQTELRSDANRARASHPDFTLWHRHLSRTTPAQLEALRTRYDFGIAQVGGNFKPRDILEIRKGSYWFVQAHVEGVRERFDRMDFSFLQGMNTLHTSLSKADIVRAYEAVLSQENLRKV